MDRILVVDDAKINRVILKNMLQDEYDIVEAADGAEAAEVFREGSTGIVAVLLDVIMPVMDGFGFLQQARNNGWLEHVPVIMISTDNTPESVSRAYELGAADYIERPFDIQTVHKKVQGVIAQNRV